MDLENDILYISNVFNNLDSYDSIRTLIQLQSLLANQKLLKLYLTSVSEQRRLDIIDSLANFSRFGKSDGRVQRVCVLLLSSIFIALQTEPISFKGNSNGSDSWSRGTRQIFVMLIGDWTRELFCRAAERKEFDFKFYASEHALTLKRHIALLHALQSAIPFVEQSIEWLSFVDVILVRMLQPTTNPLLQAKAIQILCEAFSRAKQMDVERIYGIYWPLISQLRNVTSAQCNLHPFVIKNLNLFFGAWPAKASTRTLVSFNLDAEATAKLRALDTDTFNRLVSLQAKLQPYIKSKAAISLVQACERNSSELQKLLNEPELPYEPVNPFARRSKMELAAVAQLDDDESRASSFEIDSGFFKIDADFTSPSEPETVDLETSMSFGLGKAPVIFARAPFQRDLFLQNKRSIPQTFFLEASPSPMFTASPASGLIGPNETCKVKLEMKLAHESNPVDGFLLVRAGTGLPVELVKLKAPKGDAISVFPTSVDFGVCPVGNTISVPLFVKNWSAEIVSLSAHVSGDDASSISLDYTDIEVPANSLLQYAVKFKPKALGTTSAKLVMADSFGSFFQVAIDGRGGNGVDIDEQTLDFGQIDNYSTSGAVSVLRVRNNQRTPAHVWLDSSSPGEFVLDKAFSPLKLKPLETRKIPLKWASNWAGLRTEQLRMVECKSLPTQVQLKAFCGSLVSVPVDDTIVLPATVPDKLVSAQIPIVNSYDQAVHLEMYFASSKEHPFALRCLNHELFGRKAMMGHMNAKYVSETGRLVAQLGPKSTLPVAILFGNAHPGIFSATVIVELKKPRAIPIFRQFLVVGSAIASENSRDLLDYKSCISSFYNLDAVYEPGVPSNMAKSKELLNSLVKPVVVPVEDVMQTAPPQFYRSPNCLLDAHANFVSVLANGASLGPNKAAMLNASVPAPTPYAVAVLYNSSESQSCPYKFFLSPFFVSETPATGTIPPSSALEIGIQFHPTLHKLDAFKETTFGSLVVLANAGELLSIPVYGVFNDIVDIDARPSASMLSFGSVASKVATARKILLRNKLPAETVVECRFATIAVPGDPVGASTQKVVVLAGRSEDCNFRMTTGKLLLKPYEHLSADITFSGVDSGSYLARFTLETVDTAPRYISGELVTASQKRSVRQFDLSAFVAGNYITVEPETADFGLVAVAPTGLQLCSTLNATFDSTIPLSTTTCISEATDAFSVALNPQRAEVAFQFRPQKAGVCVGNALIGDIQTQQSMALIGFGVLPHFLTTFGCLSHSLSASGSLLLSVDVDFGLCHAFKGKTIAGSWTNVSNIPFSHLIIEGAAKDGLVEFEASSVERWLQGASLNVALRIKPQKPSETPSYGSFSDTIQLHVYFEATKLFTIAHRVTGQVQPPLKLKDSTLDFGVQPLFSQQEKYVVFENSGTASIPWQIELSDYTVGAPFRVFPLQGVLAPGCYQVCDVVFSPGRSTKWRVGGVLRTPLLDQAISLEGAGGASCLSVDKPVVNFGVVRVGQQDVAQTLTLVNSGNLAAKYFIETDMALFSCDPEQGLVEGGGQIELLIRCNAHVAGKFFNKWLNISATNADLSQILRVPVRVHVTYPELVVHSKQVDFGIALLSSTNRKQIDIENLSDAEAVVALASNHTSLSLDPPVQRIPPHSRCALDLVFVPQKVEALDSRIFVKSVGTARSDFFALSAKATVGVPKLILTPADALEAMDWGTCKLGDSIVKSFKMENQGNISLSWSMEPQNKIVFSVEPSRGVLGCGDVQNVQVTFRPTSLTEYEEVVELRYEFFKLSSMFKGAGGLASLQVDFAKPISAQALEAWILRTKNQVQQTQVDFGVCRTGAKTGKELVVKNCGNLAATYKAYFKVDASRINSSTVSVQGLVISNPVGQVPPYSRGVIKLQAASETCGKLEHVLVVKHDHGILEYNIRLQFATSELQLLSDDGTTVLWDSNQSHSELVAVNLGVQALNTETLKTLYLYNPGPFELEYFVQSTGIQELQVAPIRGTIAPNKGRQPLTVAFRPMSDTKIQGSVKLLWEKGSPPLQLQLTGYGGLGKYAIAYADPTNRSNRFIDFGMVPFHSINDHRIAVVNMGAVAIPVQLSCDHDDFLLACLSAFATTAPTNSNKMKAQQVKEAVYDALEKPAKKVMQWLHELKLTLPVDGAIEIGCRFSTSSNPLPVFGNLTLATPLGQTVIPLKGKGGKIELWHEGALDFGDISNSFTYTRKVKLFNRGTIPTQLNFEWQIVGRHGSAQAGAASATASSEPFVSLEEVYSALDPRSGWTRKEYMRLHNQQPPKNGYAKWQLLKYLVVNAGAQVNGAKRRQMLYNLVAAKPVSSQSLSTTPAFVKATPGKALLQPNASLDILVQLNLASEDTFLATLIARPSSSSIPPYEIPLTATPKLVSVVCDDMSMLNFQRQSLGQSFTLQRVFTNRGRQDFTWEIHHQNSALVVEPRSGFLPVNQSVTVRFTFTPFEETPQVGKIYFEPAFSQPIRLSMFGGGGTAKCSLSKYRRFDFGPCMVGKGTCSYLPIVNEGSALLIFKSFQVSESDTFFQGVSWPKIEGNSTLHLPPGARIELPIVFHPRSDSPPAGKLVVVSSVETWEIELVGQGREAVLILSRQALEFHECLVGNTYEQVLKLKNVGDVNYPVTFAADDFPDIEFTPSSMVIPPFSENWVIIAFTPSAVLKQVVQIQITSPYSSHTIAVSLASGTATLQLSEEFLDFGLFEKTSHPSLQFTVRNVGTMKTNFAVRDSSKPRRFEFDNGRALLFPGKTATVTVIHAKEAIGKFDGRIQVKNDVVDNWYYLPVRGQCEEAVVHESEIEQLNMGICPVSFPTTKTLPLCNYGAFPLTFDLKFAYPLKVSPANGVIGGFGKEMLSVTWNPSGSYELRGTVTVVTNVGEFQLLVRGRGAFSELSLSTTVFDFGVGAVGSLYPMPLTITNKGKVPLSWTTVGLKESFALSKAAGSLAVREQETVQVIFRPLALQKYSSTLFIDCKGSSAKEVSLVGIGGNYDLRVAPSQLQFPNSPCDLTVYKELQLTNSGDVVVYMSFNAFDAAAEPATLEKPENGDRVVLALPQPLKLNPGESGRVVVGITALVPGNFETQFWITTKERTVQVPIAGDGVRIYSSAKVTRILAEKNLRPTKQVGPLDLETTNDEWSYGIGPTELERMLKLVEEPNAVLLQVVGEIEAVGAAFAAAFDKPFSVKSPDVVPREQAHAFDREVERVGRETLTALELLRKKLQVKAIDEDALKTEFVRHLATAESLKSVACSPLKPHEFLCRSDAPEANDYLIQAVMALGGEPLMDEVPVFDALCPVSPLLSDPALFILSRPPPLPVVDMEKHQLALQKRASQIHEEQQRLQKARMRSKQQYQTLDRKARNAPASGIWSNYAPYK